MKFGKHIISLHSHSFVHHNNTMKHYIKCLVFQKQKKIIFYVPIVGIANFSYSSSGSTRNEPLKTVRFKRNTILFCSILQLQQINGYLWMIQSIFTANFLLVHFKKLHFFTVYSSHFACSGVCR